MMPNALRLLFALPALAAAVEVPLPDKVGFNEHIRPILSNNCYYCHGPDEKHREADLRLDTAAGALADLGGYAAVVAGKPDDSELLKRVLATDEDDLMPPPKSKKPRLTPHEIALVRRWIEQGAPYEGHWAFQPLRDQAPPTGLKAENWVRNPIDRFILGRLEREGIAPSPEADAATLARRLYLDLVGLLPTPQEVDAFAKAVAADRTKAVADLADRLLASEHYGERWGRHWLDQARYADSDGYAPDNARAMWPYRDWVIRALNDDVPFDRFTIEQLAGDLLPEKTKSQLVASAFHRNTLINTEGGSDPEQFRVEAAIDRVNTTGAVWLGLTVGCAQCHTHKFDPITHKEFYQLYAFFNSGADVNNKGATVPVVRGEMFGKPVAKKEEPAEDRQRLQAEWEKRELAKAPATGGGKPAAWVPVEYVEFDTTSNAGFRRLEDNSLLSDGRGTFNDTYRVVVKTALPEVAAVRLRVLTHESLPKSGPGTASNGNFVLTDFEAMLDGQEVKFSRAVADHEQPDYPVSGAIDNDAKTGWAINAAKGSAAKMNANHEAAFVFEKPVKLAGRTLEIRLRHELNQKYLVGRFALDVSASAPAAAPETGLLAALRTAPTQRTPADAKLVREAFERANPVGKKGRGNDPDADEVELMVMQDLATPRQTFLFQRGDFLRPDKDLGPLQPGVIAAVAADMKNAPATFKNRRDLAEWLVHPENPLTPRVTMNRIWMHYFGRGLVETEEDFGTQGTPPSHPELLDWLGREFIRGGWSMKAMHRLIVTSATYQQASKARPDLAEKDPRNLLLARQERLRVEAEIVRDAALSASGLLDRTIGGPGFRPPQPEGVYAFTQMNKQWKESTGPARFRRGMYTVFFRSAPHPLLGTFDVPDMQTTCTRRIRSNTPLQSLTLANDVAFLEIAQGFAARLMREAADVEGRLRRGFELSLSRVPSERELAVLRDYVQAQERQFRADPEAARALLGKKDADATTAAWVCAARVLFNTDNFITRE